MVECAVLAFYRLLEENFALMAIIIGAQFQHIAIMAICLTIKERLELIIKLVKHVIISLWNIF